MTIVAAAAGPRITAAQAAVAITTRVAADQTVDKELKGCVGQSQHTQYPKNEYFIFKSGSAASQTRIERVTQSISDQVERKHGHHDCQPREKHQEGRIEDAVAFLTEH